MGRMGGRGEEIGDNSARLTEQGGLDIASLVHPDGEVQEVDGSGDKVVGLARLTFKLNGGMAGIEVSQKLEQAFLGPSPEEQHIINESPP